MVLIFWRFTESFDFWREGGGGLVDKKQYRGRDCLKRWAWTVCQFKGRLRKKEGVVSLRGCDTTMRTMNHDITGVHRTPPKILGPPLNLTLP